jgi:hypothetical protein
MRLASQRTWVRACVAGFSAVLTFCMMFWFAFAQPWVAEAISARIGFHVTIDRIYPSYSDGSFSLVIRDLVVAGKPPFDREPLAFCDRIELKLGAPIKVDVSGLDLRLLATPSADNVRGVKGAARVPSAATRQPALSVASGLALNVKSGSVSGVVQLPGGHRLAVRVAGVRAQREAGAVKAQLSGVSLDLGKYAILHLGQVDAEVPPTREFIAQGRQLSVSIPGAEALIQDAAIEASASERGWTLTANATNKPSSFSAHATLAEEAASLQLSLSQSRLAGLAPVLDKLGISVAKATGNLDVQATVARESQEVKWQIAGSAMGIGVHHPAVDKEPWRGQKAKANASGTFDWRDGLLTVDHAELAPLGIPLVASGAMTLKGPKRGHWQIASQADGWNCAKLPSHFAPSIQRALWGMELSGKARIGVDVSFDGEDWDKLGLNIQIPEKCTVSKEPGVVAQGLAQLVSGTSQFEDRPSLPVSPQAVGFTPISKMPAHLLAAFMTAEDSGFFEHQGFEPENIRRALIYDLERGRFARGASTITQQVAKNLFLSHERTVSRKLTETVLTWRIDRLLPKRRVLELYLNLVELGPDIRGVGAAAKAYFGKLPSELTPLEAVHLASLPPNPRGFARRFREGSVDDGWLARLYDLVGIMGRRGQLTADQVGAARSTRLRLRKI